MYIETVYGLEERLFLFGKELGREEKDRGGMVEETGHTRLKYP